MENQLPHFLLVVVLVLVLGFGGDFENEEDGGFDRFSHMLFRSASTHERD